MKKWLLILIATMVMLLLTKTGALAAPKVAVSQLRAADLVLVRTPDGDIRLQAGAAYRWQITEGHQLLLGVDGSATVAAVDFVDWLRFDTEYKLGKAPFSLTIPLHLKWEPDKTAAKAGLSFEKGLANSNLGLSCAYAHQWADNELLVSDKIEGSASLSASNGAWLDQKLRVDGTVLLKTNDTAEDYLRMLTGWTGQFSLSKASALRTTLEWTGYWYWNDPRENRQRYETSLEYSLKLKKLSFKVGGEAEYGTGRLADHYLALQGWTGIDVQGGSGKISVDGRVSGKNHKDPATTARDNTYWQVALGYQCSLGRFDFKALGYYEERHYDDGTGEWVFGPLASCKWHINDHWQIGLYWAPEGNMSHDEKGLRLSIAWRPK
ncbi:MAG TPA: hypothetical protein DCY84_10450 [Firmicutes bacterium]|jgi:hypothetical protein|nr:hypothetical protein [Bacillota bacterium]HBR24140.1 hypothetical protein [Bacillota bacterium]